MAKKLSPWSPLIEMARKSWAPNHCLPAWPFCARFSIKSSSRVQESVQECGIHPKANQSVGVLMYGGPVGVDCIISLEATKQCPMLNT